MQVLLRQSQHTLVYGVVLSSLVVEAAVAFGDDGDTLLCLTGAGASRLPKTLGIVLAEEGTAARDDEANA